MVKKYMQYRTVQPLTYYGQFCLFQRKANIYFPLLESAQYGHHAVNRGNKHIFLSREVNYNTMEISICSDVIYNVIMSIRSQALT